MDFTVKGQLSALILSSIEEKDMYGLEIIEDVAEKSGGEFQIKQPSLYSCLKRMESQSFISSYWKDSDLGGRRHYYSITDLGRKQLAEMQDIIAFAKRKPLLTEKKEENTTYHSPTLLQQENLFTSSDKKETSAIKSASEDASPNFVQFDLFNSEPEKDNDEKSPLMEKFEEKLAKKNDAVFLGNQPQDSKSGFSSSSSSIKMTDLSREFKRIKNRKSFADDQIAMSMNPSNHVKNKEADAEYLKNSIKYSKENQKEEFESRLYNSNFRPKEQATRKDDAILMVSHKEEPQVTRSAENLHVQKERADDAVLITASAEEYNLPKVKRIAPPNLNIYEKKTTFPTPNSNQKVESSYKEIVGNLYAQGKTKPDVGVTYESAYYNYNNLKEYYAGIGIGLKAYSKEAKAKVYNTNKIHLIRGLIDFAFTALAATICFLIFYFLNLTNSQTSFVYLLPTALLLAYVCYLLIKVRHVESKPPEKPAHIALGIALWLILSGITLTLNLLIIDAEISEILLRFDTFIYPAIALLVIPADIIISNVFYNNIKY